MIKWSITPAIAGFFVASAASFAQNPPPAGTPATSPPAARPARGGFPLPPLPATFETLQQKIRVSIVAHGLDRPWSLLILPDGDMLVSMRYSKEVRAIRKGALDPKPLTGLPEMRAMYDIVAHPKFAENKLLYFGYAKALDERRTAMVLARGRFDGGSLSNVQELYVSDATFMGGSRMAFAPDGTIYMTISGAVGRTPAGQDPRKPDTAYGKVIRLRDDGTIPPDNPFVGKPGARPKYSRWAIAISSGSHPIR